MTKYQLRKIDPQSRCANRYNSCDEFSTFSDLRDAINTRCDIWYGGGFEVLDANNEILFDKLAASHCIESYGKKFTLSQAVEDYKE